MSKEEQWNSKQNKFGKTQTDSINIAKALEIIIPKEQIYQLYVDKNNEYKEFQTNVKSHLEFLQTLCRAGLEEGDLQRLNGVINFCESFLIRNHLKDITDQGGTDETID